MKTAGLARALVLGAALVAGCGDDGSQPGIDGSIDSPIDADVDAPPPVTFTSFVIDLVEHQTADNTDPVPYATFSNLDDPDQNNPAAYSILFN